MISLPNLKDSAFVVIDVQEKLCRVMPDIEERLAKMADAAAIMSVFEVPTLVTEQYPKGLGVTMAEVASRLPPTAKLIEKTSFSCFGASEFAVAAEELQRSTMIIVGMETHVCVQQTVLDALERGSSVALLNDCVCSRNGRDELTALSLMEKAGATITTMEAMAFHWMRSSTHEKFKAVSKIVAG